MAAADRQGVRHVLYEAHESAPDEEALWRQFAALMGIAEEAQPEQTEPETADEALWREWSAWL